MMQSKKCKKKEKQKKEKEEDNKKWNFVIAYLSIG